VLDALRLVRDELRPEAALIGFAGAPFTLFCYLVEGGGSKDFMHARRFLREQPAAAADLLDLLGRSMADYLAAQAHAGADALMLFDSWIGLLGPADYQKLVVPVLRRTLDSLRARTDRPLIYFAHGGATLLDQVGALGADVVGVDWTLPLSRAVATLGPDAVVQGNLDPSMLFAPPAALGDAIDQVLVEARAAAGHVFNLGHGISRDTDPDRVAFLVDRVHERSQQERSP
jgi:uroporphyrinogen decarboxylase